MPLLNFPISIPMPYPLPRPPRRKSSCPQRSSSSGGLSPVWTPVAPFDPAHPHTSVDHMLSIEWTASEGWLRPRITPYQNLSLDPATCVFHYAFEAFEGMKAYKSPNGDLRLFRPDRNMRRFNRSVERIALPTFDGKALTELISRFVRMEKRFVPSYASLSQFLTNKSYTTLPNTAKQLPRLLPLPPPHINRHPTHPRRWSPRLRSPLPHCLPRRSLLSHRLQSHLPSRHV